MAKLKGFTLIFRTHKCISWLRLDESSHVFAPTDPESWNLHCFPKNNEGKTDAPQNARFLRTYTTWKVDGATPMYWFIMALTKPPFGSCAIYFHHGVLISKLLLRKPIISISTALPPNRSNCHLGRSQLFKDLVKGNIHRRPFLEKGEGWKRWP